MSVDKGFDFRATSTYVTDPTNCTYVLDTDTYPVTRNGITFGWLDTPGGGRDRNANSGDAAKLAGVNFGQTVQRFQVDLGGAGTADIRLAMGDGGGAQTQEQVKVKDNTTTRLTIGPSDTTTQHWVDASGVDRGPESDWTSNNVAATALSFSSGTLIVTLEGPAGVTNTCLAHLFFSFTATGVAAAMGGPGARGNAGHRPYPYRPGRAR